MARDWSSQNPHARSEPEPKLTVVGRLQGTADGWPFLIEAGGNEIVLSTKLGGLRSFLKLTRAASPLTERVQWERMPKLKLKIEGFLDLNIKPRSILWKRFFKPARSSR